MRKLSSSTGEKTQLDGGGFMVVDLLKCSCIVHKSVHIDAKCKSTDLTLCLFDVMLCCLT